MGLAAFLSKLLLIAEMVLDKFVHPATFAINDATNQWVVNSWPSPTSDGISLAMGVGGIIESAVAILAQLLVFFAGPVAHISG